MAGWLAGMHTQSICVWNAPTELFAWVLTVLHEACFLQDSLCKVCCRNDMVEQDWSHALPSMQNKLDVHKSSLSRQLTSIKQLYNLGTTHATGGVPTMHR
jgi:hypothetical protein